MSNSKGIAGIYKTKAEAEKVARLLQKVSHSDRAPKVEVRYILVNK